VAWAPVPESGNRAPATRNAAPVARALAAVPRNPAPAARNSAPRTRNPAPAARNPAPAARNPAPAARNSAPLTVAPAPAAQKSAPAAQIPLTPAETGPKLPDQAANARTSALDKCQVCVSRELSRAPPAAGSKCARALRKTSTGRRQLHLHLASFQPVGRLHPCTDAVVPPAFRPRARRTSWLPIPMFPMF
jgi:hypothetical protein